MKHRLTYGLKCGFSHDFRRAMGRLGGAPAWIPRSIALAYAVLPISALAQQPVVEDRSGSPDGFYQQTETRSSGNLVMFNQVQEHQRELQQLHGQVEELRHELEKLRNQSQQRYLDLDGRLASAAKASNTNRASTDSGEAGQADAGSGNADSGSKSGNTSENADMQEAEPSVTSGAAQKDYQAAFAHVQAREFDQAITAFEQFVSEHPETRLTPNGYYWLGELHASENNLDAAEKALTRVIDKHAGSSKVPDALYKLGLVKARQGETERSRELLKQVKDDYPQSTAAGLASDYLRQSED